jgi:outer membrane protein TolC
MLSSALVAIVVAGCASYTSKPLPEQPVWQSAAPVQGEQLTVDQVVAAALEHSPDVRQARRDLEVAAAKRYADDLLPDPQLLLSKDFPGAAGFVPAFMAGISYEVSALITHAAKEQASLSDYEQRRLAMQWVQWQVANRAYEVFVTSICLERLQHRTEELLAWQRMYRDRMQAALTRGEVTVDTAARAEAGYLDNLQQLNVLRQDLYKAQQELNVLLDLPPGQELKLAAPPEPVSIPAETVQSALADLPHRRPDLQALAAGYEAQDERYRAAILAQFPRLEVGFTRGRDTSAIYTTGFTVSVALPLFNRNQGNIAIEKATRESLHDEYSQRLKDASAAVQATMTELEMLDTQLRNAEKAEQALERSQQATRRAYGRGDADLAALSEVNTRLLAQRIATTRLENSMLQLQATLCTLIGVSAIDHQPLQQNRT